MWYQNLKQKNVTSFVLVVISNASFMGCSPGGCIIDESLLIEIKCPILGKKLHIVEVLTKLPYLTKTDNGYQLKLKNAYYGQVQLNMAILNLKKCDLILYSKFSKSRYIIQIPCEFQWNIYLNFKRCLFQTLYLPIYVNST